MTCVTKNTKMTTTETNTDASKTTRTRNIQHIEVSPCVCREGHEKSCCQHFVTFHYSKTDSHIIGRWSGSEIKDMFSSALSPIMMRHLDDPCLVSD